ncbi:hypothetical protein PSHT_15903 [Puccinia striiformis]|uniref:Amidohydrolase-related domain-containing protein n=1 Tax=Puccinia striiformis TaxID=27350 RepID=A0A2S4UCH7_9BASI|nr:hypothetical protein PSHT_15903 [Puccinia striiformis]
MSRRVAWGQSTRAEDASELNLGCETFGGAVKARESLTPGLGGWRNAGRNPGRLRSDRLLVEPAPHRKEKRPASRKILKASSKHSSQKSAMPKKAPPQLPLSAFGSTAANDRQAEQLLARRIPLLAIDAHVYLPQPADAKLWQDSIQPLCPTLEDQHSENTTQFKGFIYIHQQPVWLLDPIPEDALDADKVTAERWDTEAQNIIRNPPRDIVRSLNVALARVHRIDKELCEIRMAPPIGQVIWAPLRQGASVLGSYLDQLSGRSVRICGCSYLIERKSETRNVSLVDPLFIESLKLLAERGLSVEFMVEGNHERSAKIILDEVLECVSAVRLGQDSVRQTKFVLCQMDFHIKLSGLPLILEEELKKRACDRFLQFHKPNNSHLDLGPSTPVAVDEDEDATKQDNDNKDKDKGSCAQGESAWREVKKRIKFYLEPILEAFGDHRLIYASGFPYYDVPQEVSSPASKTIGLYECQFEIFRECLTEFGLENGALDNVFGLNAQRCYSV